MKKYVLYAGVNGAGKSTLYQTNRYQTPILRVNTDEILRNFGDWRNGEDLMKAGKIAVRTLQQYLSDGVTFNQETTLCGKSVINTIGKAKNLGYYIQLYYVGVNTVEIAKSRIATRVANGGHGIPDAVVEKRYVDSFKNLKTIMPMCDLVFMYDNTEQFRRFAIFKGGKVARLSRELPDWYKERF